MPQKTALEENRNLCSESNDIQKAYKCKNTFFTQKIFLRHLRSHYIWADFNSRGLNGVHVMNKKEVHSLEFKSQCATIRSKGIWLQGLIQKYCSLALTFSSEETWYEKVEPRKGLNEQFCKLRWAREKEAQSSVFGSAVRRGVPAVFKALMLVRGNSFSCCHCMFFTPKPLSQIVAEAHQLNWTPEIIQYESIGVFKQKGPFAQGSKMEEHQKLWQHQVMAMNISDARPHR